MKCFYHNDLDGQCSAYWVRKYCEVKGMPFEASDFIEMNYDRHVPDVIYELHEDVFIVDFSFEEIELLKIWNMTGKSPIWIDHHKSAIEKYQNFKFPRGESITGLRYDGIAGCALTWIYLFGEEGLSFEDLVKKLPLFTYYVHLWDTWKWKDFRYLEREELKAFIIGLEASNTHVEGIWSELDHHETGQKYMVYIREKGRHMLTYRTHYASDLCSSIGKVIDFEGYKCFVCNMPRSNSEWFSSVKEPYDILMPFYYNAQTEQFIVSLYSSAVDVSAIAVKYGAGGHKNAAGFHCSNLPF